MQQTDQGNSPVLNYERPTRRGLGWKLIAIGAMCHFVVFIALLMFTFSRGMARFDSGAKATTTEALARIAYHVLSFPLLPGLSALRVAIPGLAVWLVLLANSLCWGIGVWLAVWAIRQMRSTA